MDRRKTMETTLTFSSDELGMIRAALREMAQTFYDAGGAVGMDENNRVACVRYAKKHTELIQKIDEGVTE
jgi:hypothetical protein